MRSASEILRDAADIVQFEGWGRGELFADGRYCVAGAINQAAFGSPWYQRGTFFGKLPSGSYGDAVLALVARVAPDGNRYISPFTAIARWNNFDAANGDEVADTMRRAAKDLEAGGEGAPKGPDS